MTESVEQKTQATQAKDEPPVSHAERVKKSDWAIDASVAKPAEEKPKSFLQRIIPKSRRGRVVFAAATAQVVSMVAMPVASHLIEQHKPGALEKLERYLANVFKKEPKLLKGFLNSRGWNGLFDYEEHQVYDNAETAVKRTMQAEKLVEFSIQGLVNIGTTMATRDILDKKLNINAGTGAVVKTQMLDTAVAMGALIGIPFLGEKSRKMRGSISNFAQSLGAKPKFAKKIAFSTWNLALPDMLGFSTGLITMLGELDEKAAKHEKEQEHKKSKESAPGRA